MEHHHSGEFSLFHNDPVKCDWCGKDIIPSPDNFVDDKVFANVKRNDPDLTDSQIHELLTTGKVEGLTQCVCFECQDSAVELDDDPATND